MKLVILSILFVLFNCSESYDKCVRANNSRRLGYIAAVAACNSGNQNKSNCDLWLANVLVNAVNYPTYCDGTENY